ncbi:hypothetical protein GIB67_040039 [Kingdonia uniflora]|uniref:DUF7780 domain-containing protein n=1 Tax=Kingdonia uniflora TaxID=39325 RepID=A0A7J7MUE5_9MAGN|nr:hypothetical protein GIB67_040039 [Kingdonia uniflora]
MGFTSKGNEGGSWGLGLLLVFSPPAEEGDERNIDTRRRRSSSTGDVLSRNNNVLFTKAQSTISICALIVFFTLLLFTLCTFEPNNTLKSASPNLIIPRRWLRDQNKGSYYSKIKSYRNKGDNFALQSLGVLFRRGTKGMSDLVVAHVPEDTKEEQFRLFMRTMHRSGLTSKSDVVLIFPSNPIALNPNLSTPIIVSQKFSSIIQEENESFLKLVQQYRSRRHKNESTGFDVSLFVKSNKEKSQGGLEPIWGRKIQVNNYTNIEDLGKKKTELSWGSVVGFEAAELDPEDSLSGFSEHRPISLRRWACYPMLLGRVRRSFKHIMLVNVNHVLILGDSLSRVRNRGADSVYFTKTHSSHNKKEHSSSSSVVVMGGTRGVRRLSSAMLNEIVRASTTTTQHKNKSSVSDSTVLSQLIRNEPLLKSTNIVASELSITKSIIIRRGNNSRNDDLDSSIGREICLSTLNSSFVYRDC